MNGIDTTSTLDAAGEIRTVGVLGSGIMGAGLVEVVARSGRSVILRSRTQQTADAAVAKLTSGLDRQVDKGRLEAAERDAILGRITATDDVAALAECDLVIESVVEDLAVKKSLFAELDAVVAPHAILATNTSTLPVVEIAMATGRPDRVCGIHFFNPAPMMKLVEIVKPLTASDDTISTALAFATSCGKDAVEVVDRAGFIVNALLFPYLNNAIKMWENGTASMSDIDTAMQGGCNFPMGPFALLDLVGLDTSLAILEALHAEFGDANFMAATSLKRMVAAGHLGRKSGRGFLAY
ncbi:3-hydroxyacyl-CoA dehydrogenase family protein [Ilumatobacter sp.]|uniref:3-hydroxyacyl-CoA dehydrogenase family protein n=1 Tax=Ilumatobacter sp. TaxID=1967498 RepID=UPI003C3C308F